MNQSPRAMIEAIYREAIGRVDARNAVREALRLEKPGRLRIGAQVHAIPTQGVFAVAVGKAAVPMLAAVEELLGGHLRSSIAVTKAYDGTPRLQGRVMLGSHPTPDERSIEAGLGVLDFAEAIPHGALVLCLVSGGGSALIEALRPGVTLSALQAITNDLLRAGADIHELNAVRSRLSRIKAGGLLAALSGRTVSNIVVSDAIGDSPSTIASGPTMPPTPGPSAEEVVLRYGIQIELPESESTSYGRLPSWTIVANLSMAIDAAAEHARSLGFEPFVLTRSLSGEAREVGTAVASIVADTASDRTSIHRPACIIAGGETVVTVRADGRGGRNTECALAAAMRLSGTEGASIGFLTTDGDDAMTGLAGAIIDGTTVDSSMMSAARHALTSNDSAEFLEARGATLRTGPTGTNVNDLVIALVT